MNYILLLMLLLIAILFTSFAFLLPSKRSGEGMPDIFMVWRMASAFIAVGLWFVLALAVGTIDYPMLYVSETASNYVYDGSGNIDYINTTYTVAWSTNQYEAAYASPVFMGIGIIMVVYVIHLILSMLQATAPWKQPERDRSERELRV